jgi:hypothetical protein
MAVSFEVLATLDRLHKFIYTLFRDLAEIGSIARRSEITLIHGEENHGGVTAGVQYSGGVGKL